MYFVELSYMREILGVGIFFFFMGLICSLLNHCDNNKVLTSLILRLYVPQSHIFSMYPQTLNVVRGLFPISILVVEQLHFGGG